MKRFYKEVTVSLLEPGYAVLLDGKAIKTPKRTVLSLPKQALAEAVADEWRAQGETIEPRTMPLTRLAYAAIDVVTPERERVTRQILEYAGSDLLCYRAEEPPELVARQAYVWDPLLTWAREIYGAPLNVSAGIRHVAQAPGTIAALGNAISHYSDFELAALHTAITVTGSLILALALAEKRLDAAEAFAAATLDETFQAEKWGSDAAAEQRRAHMLPELVAAERFLRLLEA